MAERTTTRGFGSMDQSRQKEIASKGGKAAHRSGHAHQFTKDEARAAGRKGGEAVSSNREHMREIGKKGGQASGGRRRKDRDGQSDGMPLQSDQQQPQDAELDTELRAKPQHNRVDNDMDREPVE